MNEVIVIFCLAATGCLVRLSTDLVLQLFARKVPNETIVSGPGQGPTEARAEVDPVVTFGLTLTCYGAIALLLVSALPGSLANERTCLAFALLCVGGLVGEISRARTQRRETDAEAEAGEPGAAEPITGSVGLSVALMLTLNVAIAVLCSGQGLIQVVPPPAAAAEGASTQLEQIVVVARRGGDDSGTPSFL